MEEKKIAWAITGAGHFLEEVITLISNDLQQRNEEFKSDFIIDIFLSKAAFEVLGMYDLAEQIENCRWNIYKDKTGSSPIVGRFYKNYYDLLVVAPATSNTIAKLAAGISDNLVTNLFAHAGKCRVPTIVLPTDNNSDITSSSPQGEVKVYPRKIDLANVKKLKGFSKVKLMTDIREVTLWLKDYLSQES